MSGNENDGRTEIMKLVKYTYLLICYSGQRTEIPTDGLQCTRSSPGILSIYSIFFLVHDMGWLSRVATVSSGIMQTVGES